MTEICTRELSTIIYSVSLSHNTDNVYTMRSCNTDEVGIFIHIMGKMENLSHGGEVYEHCECHLNLHCYKVNCGKKMEIIFTTQTLEYFPTISNFVVLIVVANVFHK